MYWEATVNSPQSFLPQPSSHICFHVACLAFWATSAHCWFASSFSSTSIPVPLCSAAFNQLITQSAVISFLLTIRKLAFVLNNSLVLKRINACSKVGAEKKNGSVLVQLRALLSAEGPFSVLQNNRNLRFVQYCPVTSYFINLNLGA